MEEHGSARGGSATEQISDKAVDLARQAEERAADLAGKAQQASGQAQDRVKGELDRRSTSAGEQMRSVADVMRHTSQELRSRGNEPHAKLADTAADRMDRVGGYLANADADQILADVEDLARRQPLVAAAGGLILGLAAARFLKASGDRRYDDYRRRTGTGGTQLRPGAFEQAYASPPASLPPATLSPAGD
jgi:hypothetical protein